MRWLVLSVGSDGGRPSNAGLGSVERRDCHLTWSSEPREGLTIS